MFTLWETFHEKGDTYKDTGRRFLPEKLGDVRRYAKKRLYTGVSLGWYIENDAGAVLERQTLPGNFSC